MLGRGDFASAGLDLVGVLPIVGEVADAKRIAKVADNAVDAVKTAKKATNFIEYPKKVHIGRQGKHIINHNNYKKGRSYILWDGE